MVVLQVAMVGREVATVAAAADMTDPEVGTRARAVGPEAEVAWAEGKKAEVATTAMAKAETAEVVGVKGVAERAVAVRATAVATLAGPEEQERTCRGEGRQCSCS